VGFAAHSIFIIHYSLMTGSVHAAIGAAVGSLTRNRVLAFALGLGTHLVGDVVPHHDMGATETPLVFATLVRVAQQHGLNSPQFWGALGGVCPDFEHMPAEWRQDPRRFGPMKEKLFPTHNGLVKHAKWPYAENWGVLMQVVLFAVGLYLSRTLNELHSANAGSAND